MRNRFSSPLIPAIVSRCQESSRIESCYSRKYFSSRNVTRIQVLYKKIISLKFTWIFPDGTVWHCWNICVSYMHFESWRESAWFL